MDALNLPVLAIVMLIGVVIGAGAAWAWFRFGSSDSESPAARKREEAYRREVADHFVDTAQLVNRLTDSYKEVFDHLREGAGKLVDEETLRERLAHEEDKDVTLHLIGYRESRRDEGARGGTGKSAGDDTQ